MAASSGRKGRPWRRARAEVLAVSTVCHLCGHPGAGDADHDPLPRKTLIALGLDPDDPAYLKPAHGAFSRCPVCSRCCNQMKGDRAHLPTSPQSRAW